MCANPYETSVSPCISPGSFGPSDPLVLPDPSHVTSKLPPPPLSLGAGAAAVPSKLAESPISDCHSHRGIGTPQQDYHAPGPGTGCKTNSLDIYLNHAGTSRDVGQ